MTKPLCSFHSLQVHSTSISKEKSSLLLDRTIKIFFRRKDKSVGFVDATIFEIFTKCQASLASTFDLRKFSISGSSVAHIFSGEHFADIDIHGFIDLSLHSPSTITKRGYEIKWFVLDSISRIINEKLALFPAASESINSLDQIIFEEQFVPLSTKEMLPFNVHSLKLGSIPIEFTFFAIIHDDFRAQRFFDFNCGALELQIDSQNTVSLHSAMPDISAVLQEISRRELRCESPSQLVRKSICRYLLKVSISGYFDLDPALLPSFITNLKERKKFLNDDENMIQELMKEIVGYFKSKDLDPFIALINLYFSHAETLHLKQLKEAAIDYLLGEFGHSSNSYLKAITHLISQNNLTECAWYFLCLAKKIHCVSHRANECLQLEIPLANLFDNDRYEDRVFYLNLPLVELWKLHSVECPGFFLQLLACPNYFESYSENARLSLNLMLSHVLIKKHLGSVLSAVLNRLKIKVNNASSHIILHQLSLYRQSSDYPLPFFFVRQVLEHSAIASITTPNVALEIIRQVSLNLTLQEAVDFEASLQQPLIIQSISMILRNSFLDTITVKERQELYLFAQFYIHKTIDEITNGPIHDNQWFKIIINNSYNLYLKELLPLEIALKAVMLCFKNNLITQGLLYLKTIFEKTAFIEREEVGSCLAFLIEKSLRDFNIFCFNNKELLKERSGSLVCDLFFETLISKKYSELPLASFVEFYAFFLTQEKKEAFNLNIFQMAVSQVPIYQILFDYFKSKGLLTLNEFKNISSPSRQELSFLFMQDTFNQTLLKDEEFARFYIKNCFSLDLYCEFLNSMKSFLTDSCQGREEFFLLLSQQALKPDLFVEVLNIFNSLSIDSFDDFIGQEILNEILMALNLFLHFKEEGNVLFLNEEALASIAFFHKKYLKVTLNNPCWIQLWGMLNLSHARVPFSSWLDFQDLQLIIKKISPHGPLQLFLSAFEHDYRFICNYIYLVSLLDSSMQKLHNEMIGELLSNKSYSICQKAECENNENIPAASYVMDTVLSLIDGSNIASVKEENMAKVMYLLLFAVHFGNWKIRNKALDFIVPLTLHEHEPGSSFLRSSGFLEEVFFAALDTAVKEYNLKELKNVTDLFTKIFVFQNKDDLPYTKMCFKQLFRVKSLMIERSQLWNNFLKQIVSKSASLDPLVDECCIQSLDCYIRFLIQSVITIYNSFELAAVSEKSSGEGHYLQEIKALHFQDILNILDILGSKKYLKSSSVTNNFICLIGFLDEEDVKSFTTKFINYAISQIRYLDIGSKDSDSIQSGYLLFKHAAMFLAHIEQKFKKLKDIRQNISLLEVARSRLTCFINDTLFMDSEFLHTISFVEGGLKTHDAINYFDSWLANILLRSQTQSVSYSEISLFTIFTFRCDPRFTKSIANGQNFERFENKQFINLEFFRPPSRIKNLISLFELVFQRYHQHLGDEALDSKVMNLDIFSFFGVYFKHIQEGIDNLKSQSDACKFRMQIIEVLVNALEKPLSRVSLYVLQGIWGNLLMIDDAGIFSFKNKSKEQITKSVIIFHRLVESLKVMPQSFISEHDVPFEQLFLAFDYHKSAFQKTLSKAQNASIFEFLESKTKDSISSFFEGEVPFVATVDVLREEISLGNPCQPFSSQDLSNQPLELEKMSLSDQ